MSADHPFGEAVPGEAVRASELEAADRREADERQQRAKVCEGCGRTWRHNLSTGHGSHTICIDGQWWHPQCYDRRRG